jgi:hypothetical protein
VARLVGGGGPLALLFGVSASAFLRASLARRCGAHLDRAGGDLAAARLLRELLQLVGRLVHRLQVALVLELPARRGDIGVPALGLAPARKLDRALVERRIDLQEEDGLLDVQHVRHDPSTLATR